MAAGNSFCRRRNVKSEMAQNENDCKFDFLIMSSLVRCAMTDVLSPAAITDDSSLAMEFVVSLS